MPRRPPAGLENRLPHILAANHLSWAELRRRTYLSEGTIARLRRADANPPLGVAERVAAALGLAVEDVWRWRAR